MNDQQCRMCGGSLHPATINHIQPFEGRYVLIEHLPALVCERCGETYLTPDSHDLIVRILQGSSTPTRIEPVAVYDLSA
ncbi:MAG: type II toxin-antitoxin system MqsA family antitoxin [Anaerolineae bacterium]|nr:type II toxin-antitoxin system MqsA family antitoxin [Anaerolineae bacterium]